MAASSRHHHQANSTPEQRLEFGHALRNAADRVGLTTSFVLAEALAAIGHPYTERMCARWLLGTHEPPRPIVVALEQLTVSPPGSLSSHLGWVPVEALSPDLEVVVNSDPDLRDYDKPLVLTMIESLKKQARSDLRRRKLDHES